MIDKNRAEKEASLSTGGDLKNQYAQVGNNVDMGIDIKSLSFSYPSQPSRIVLDGISLSVRPRELVAFVGKSGSGKSTLLSIISGLYNCKKGEVVVGGCDLSASKDMLINEQVWLSRVKLVLPSSVELLRTHLDRCRRAVIRTILWYSS